MQKEEPIDNDRFGGYLIGFGILLMVLCIVVFFSGAVRAAEPSHSCGASSIDAKFTITSATGTRTLDANAPIPSGSCVSGMVNVPTHFKLHFTLSDTATGTAPPEATGANIALCADDSLDTADVDGSCANNGNNAFAAPFNGALSDVFLTQTGLTNGANAWGTMRLVLRATCAPAGSCVGGVWTFDSDSTFAGTACTGCTVGTMNSPGLRVGANLNSLSQNCPRNPCDYPTVSTITATVNATAITPNGHTPIPGGETSTIVLGAGLCSPGKSSLVTARFAEGGSPPESATVTFNVDTDFPAKTVACQATVTVPSLSNLDGTAWASFTGSSVGSLANPLSSTSTVTVASFLNANSAIQFGSTSSAPADGKVTIANLPVSGRVNRGFAITATHAVFNAGNVTVDCTSSTDFIKDAVTTIQTTTVSPVSHIYTTTRTITTNDPRTHDDIGDPWHWEFSPGTAGPCFSVKNPTTSSAIAIHVSSLLNVNSLPHGNSQTATCPNIANVTTYVIAVDVGASCAKIQDANGVNEGNNAATCNFKTIDPNANSHDANTGVNGNNGFCGPFDFTPVAPQGLWTLSLVTFDTLGNSGGANLTVTFTSPDTSPFMLTIRYGNVNASSTWVNFTVRCNQQDPTGPWLAQGNAGLCDTPNMQIHGYNSSTGRFFNITKARPMTKLSSTNDGYFINWTTCANVCVGGRFGPFPVNRTDVHNFMIARASANMSAHLIHDYREVSFPVTLSNAQQQEVVSMTSFFGDDALRLGFLIVLSCVIIYIVTRSRGYLIPVILGSMMFAVATLVATGNFISSNTVRVEFATLLIALSFIILMRVLLTVIASWRERGQRADSALMEGE